MLGVLDRQFSSQQKVRKGKVVLIFVAMLLQMLIATHVHAQKSKKSEKSAIPPVYTQSTKTILEVMPGSLNGVEMSYKALSEKEIEITLSKYFYCTQFPIDSHESVRIQETLVNASNQKLDLKLVSVKDSSVLVNVNCPNYKGFCVKKVMYTGKAAIMNPMMGGYDITWGYCCWDDMHTSNIQGIVESKTQGLTLNLHIPELKSGEKNSSPTVLQQPVLATCKNQLIVISCNAFDEDGDSLGYVFSKMNNYKQANGMSYEGEPIVFGGQRQNKSFAGARPPFIEVLFKDGYSYLKPMGGKQMMLDSKNGDIQLKADSIGDYLMAISVLEYRNRKLLGSYQRVFSIHVAD